MVWHLGHAAPTSIQQSMAWHMGKCSTHFHLCRPLQRALHLASSLTPSSPTYTLTMVITTHTFLTHTHHLVTRQPGHHMHPHGHGVLPHHPHRTPPSPPTSSLAPTPPVPAPIIHTLVARGCSHPAPHTSAPTNTCTCHVITSIPHHLPPHHPPPLPPTPPACPSPARASIAGRQ